MSGRTSGMADTVELLGVGAQRAMKPWTSEAVQ